MISSKDANFMGYTYKNFEIVQDHEVPGIGNVSFWPSSFYFENINFLDNSSLNNYLPFQIWSLSATS